MKRIGLLSFQNANSYGALMQMFALKRSLEKLGVGVTVIDYECPHLDSVDAQMKEFREFKHRYFKLSDHYKDAKFIDTSGFDIVITGSDQVWNPELTEDDGTYFLDFVKDKKIVKASYAASMGNSKDLDSRVGKLLKENIETFDYISIREKQQESIVRKYTDKQVLTCLDPTLLLQREDYYELIEDGDEKEGYILVFSLGFSERIRDFANILSLYTGRKLKAVTYYWGEYSYIEGTDMFQPASIPKWLSLIKNAGLVLTDSFHGMMFSIIFQRPFYSFVKRGERSLRIANAIKELGLCDRTFSNILSPEKADFSIDYGQTNRVLEEKRKTSLDYLNKIICHEKSVI